MVRCRAIGGRKNQVRAAGAHIKSRYAGTADQVGGRRRHTQVSAALASLHEALENFLRDEAPLCRELSGYDGNLSAYFTFVLASAFGNSEPDIDSAKIALSSCVKLPELPPGVVGTLQVECLDANWFTWLTEARRVVETWRGVDKKSWPPKTTFDGITENHGHLLAAVK